MRRLLGKVAGILGRGVKVILDGLEDFSMGLGVDLAPEVVAPEDCRVLFRMDFQSPTDIARGGFAVEVIFDEAVEGQLGFAHLEEFGLGGNKGPDDLGCGALRGGRSANGREAALPSSSMSTAKPAPVESR
jgi:hypothetical protein